MKGLFFFFVLTLSFLDLKAQDSCECKNIDFKVKIENLYDKVYVIKTRNNTASYILNPLKFTVSLKYNNKHFDFPYSETLCDLDPYHNWNPYPIRMNNNKEDYCSITDTLKYPFTFVKNTKTQQMIDFIHIEPANNKNTKTFSVYNKDISCMRTSIGFDHNIIEFIDSSEETKTYSYIFERAVLNEMLVNDTLCLVYFNIPFNALLLLKDKEKCFIESNVFKLPLANTDTLEIQDRIDTFIDYQFYQHHYPIEKNLLTDLGSNFIRYGILFNRKALFDSLLSVYNINNKQIKIYRKKLSDAERKYTTGDYIYIFKSKYFKLKCFSNDGDNFAVRTFTYYFKKKSPKREYMFYGLYSDDLYSNIFWRINNKYNNPLVLTKTPTILSLTSKERVVLENIAPWGTNKWTTFYFDKKNILTKIEFKN